MITATKNTKAFYNTEIPSDWEIVEIGDIIDYKKGFAFKNEDYKQEGIRIIRVSDTNASGIRKEGNVFLEFSRAEEFKEWAINENDIIIQTVGSRPPLYDSMVGKTILVQSEFDGSLLNQNAVRIRIKVGHNIFLYAHLKTKRYFDFIETLVRGNANQVSITLDDLFKFKIPLPPLIEQKAIAQVLSTADAAIHTTEKLIAQKELRKKWLMQQLLTGKKRLKGFGGEVKLKLVEHYLKEVSERNKDLKITNVLSVTNSRGFINQAEQFDRVVASEDATNYKIVRKGQFAYNPSRVNVGSLDLLRDFESGILSPMYVVFETDKAHLLSDYFYYQLKTQWFYGHIPMFVQGSVRDSLSFDGLCSMKFFIPSIEEQTAIAHVLQAADKEISLLKAKAEKLREQKKGLMQVLLTGKVRLKIKE